MVHGFLGSLGAIRRQVGGLGVRFIVAWDQNVSEFRASEFAGYKAHRYDPESDEDRVKLVAYNAARVLTQEILALLNIPSIRVHGVEADDILAYLCRLDYGCKKVILSDDRDLLQLMGPDVDVYRGIAHQYFDVAKLISMPIKGAKEPNPKFSLDPDNWRKEFVLMRAIAGDKSDGIPGVNGCGEKVALPFAKKILQSPDKPDTWGKGKRADAVRVASKEGVLKRNLKLMDLGWALDNSDMGEKIHQECKTAQRLMANTSTIEIILALAELELSERIRQLWLIETCGSSVILPE